MKEKLILVNNVYLIKIQDNITIFKIFSYLFLKRKKKNQKIIMQFFKTEVEVVFSSPQFQLKELKTHCFEEGKVF